MKSTGLSKKFNPGEYPDIKPTVPCNRSLRICGACKKPGYMYLHRRKSPNVETPSVYFIHYNEPPISLIKRRDRAVRFEYRRCTKNGVTYNTLEEALADTARKTKRRKLV